MIQFKENIEPFRKPYSCQKEENKKTKYNRKNKEQILRGSEHYAHQHLREVQRYGTLCVNYKQMADAVLDDKAVIISQNDNVIKALVRYSSHYYVVIFDCVIKVIKTLLPPDSCDLLYYVQLYIEKQQTV